MRFLQTSAILAAAILPVAIFSADPPPPALASGPEYTSDGQLKFPEHYREWVYLSSGIGMTYGPIAESGASGPPMFDNVFVNPGAYRSFLETGRWPEKTILVMEARSSESHASINNGGHFQTDLVGVEVNVKDSSSPAGVWNFYGFSIDGGKRQAAAKPVPHTASCFTCHGVKTAVENTFVQFYPSLYDVAERKGTLNPGFQKLPITPGKLYQSLLEGGWKQAGPALQEAAQHAPDANVLNIATLGNVSYRLIQANRSSDAKALLEFASGRNPKSALLQDLLADAYEKLGDKAASRTATERSLALLKEDSVSPPGLLKRIPRNAEERMKRL